MLKLLGLRSIKNKLGLAFLSVLGVAVVMGALGTLGNVLTGLELRQLGQIDLPNTERATRIERIATELELQVVTYQLQPLRDAARVAEILETSQLLQAELQKAEMATLAASHLQLAKTMETSLRAHENLGALHFKFGENSFVLSDFLEFVGHENRKFLQELSDASRLGAFASVNTDPQATVFARWRREFGQDVGLAEYLENYAAREVELLSFVASDIVGAPQDADAKINAMIAQRIAALDKALKSLTNAALAREKELAAENEAQIAVVREVLSAFMEAVLEGQLASARAMYNSVEHAKMVGIIMAVVSTVIFLLGLGITIGAMVWSRRSIGAPLEQLAEIMRYLSRKDDAITVPYRERRDEIGEVAEAAEDFRIALVRQRELELQAVDEQEAAQVARMLAEEKTREVDLARAEAEKARNYHAKKSAVADAFFVAFSRIVKQAESGEFEERIGVRFDDKDYDSLSNAVNRMMDSIEASLWETGQVVGDLAAGRLNTRMSGDYAGSFAALQKDVNATAERLRSVVQGISETSIAVSKDTVSLSQNADVLSQRSAAQSGSIEKTNNSLAQVTKMIAENVTGAERVSNQANCAADQARSGQRVVSDAVSAMAEIEESGRKVSEIVDVISDISFQTNLLALNAGVEAARAGEAGKGFMVVAQEVRQLAQRASEAGRDIGALIVQSTTDVEKGVALVRSTGEVLDGIVNAISDVETTAEEITGSSREQEKSVRGIAVVMQDLDSTAQENTDAAENTAHAVRRLNEQTVELENLLEFFRDRDGELKNGRKAGRPERKSSYDENDVDKRSEPYVGASLHTAANSPDQVAPVNTEYPRVATG